MARVWGSGLLSVMLVLGACRDSADGGVNPGAEIFRFEVQPPDVGGEEAARRIQALIPVVTIVPGSAEHLAWVESLDGRFDVYRYDQLDPDQGSVGCLATIAEWTRSTRCGRVGGPGLDAPLEIHEATFGRWRSILFLVTAEVDLVLGTADDGTEYIIEPANGVGYVDWPNERGSMTLVALDADGNELMIEYVGP